MAVEKIKSSYPKSVYQEFPVGPVLSKYIVCLWRQSIGNGSSEYRQKVLPDGCVDIVLTGNSKPVVVGPNTRPFTALLPARSTTLGIRFRPGVAAGLLGLPLNLMVDQEIGLSEVYGRESDLLYETAASNEEDSEKFKALENLIYKDLFVYQEDRLVTASVEWIANHPDDLLEELYPQLNVSSRQLHRKFLSAVGYGPKTLQKILRFQNVIFLGRKRPEKSLVELSMEAGYSDQAHMTRDFKDLAGVPPSQMVSRIPSPLAMSDLFKTE